MYVSYAYTDTYRYVCVYSEYLLVSGKGFSSFYYRSCFIAASAMSFTPSLLQTRAHKPFLIFYCSALDLISSLEREEPKAPLANGISTGS